MNATDASQKTISDALPADHTADIDPRDILDQLADDLTMVPDTMDFHVACAAADCVRVTLGRLTEECR